MVTLHFNEYIRTNIRIPVEPSRTLVRLLAAETTGNGEIIGGTLQF